MIAIDTNMLVRFFVESDIDIVEHKIAAAFIENNTDLFVPRSVLLEFEWVLRGVYKKNRQDAHEILSGLLNIANVTVENEGMAHEAMRHYQAGLDFADSMHLAASAHCEKLATLDQKFAKGAQRLGLKPPCIVPG